MSRKIPLVDLMFLLMETKVSPAHVAALMLFRLPSDAGERHVAELTDLYRKGTPVAPFNWIPEFPRLGMPRWVEAGALDMRYHVRHMALPDGATWSDFHELVGELHSQVLDRSRPGFRAYFIEGLPDRQFALFFMFHHSLVDGASAIARIAASLDESAYARTVRPIYSIGFEGAAPGSGKTRSQALAALKSIAAKQSVALAILYQSLLKKGIGRGGPGAGSAPFTAPRVPMNAPLRTGRAIATLSLPLAEMKAVGRAFGGTINDVAVTVVDAALHRYLDELGANRVDHLVALCPLSLREAGDNEATTKATTMFVPLAKRAVPIAKRMEVIMRSTASAKAELLGMNKDAAMIYSLAAFGLSELAVRTGIDVITPPAANLILSNVPGPRTELFLNGARLQAIYPISGLGAGIGLNVTLISYAGAMNLGLTGNGASLPGLDRLARHTEEAFAVLRRAAGRRRVVTPAEVRTTAPARRRKAPAARVSKISAPRR